MDNATLNYYGAEKSGVYADNPQYPGIHTPQDMYRAMLNVWCAESCAPRMRGEWSDENKTLGQCSITAFLVQDIFGGEVRGIPLADGSVHCFNTVGGVRFDLTSEQFGAAANTLCYENREIQEREKHFSDADKRQRYELICALLAQRCKK